MKPAPSLTGWGVFYVYDIRKPHEIGIAFGVLHAKLLPYVVHVMYCANARMRAAHRTPSTVRPLFPYPQSAAHPTAASQPSAWRARPALCSGNIMRIAHRLPSISTANTSAFSTVKIILSIDLVSHRFECPFYFRPRRMLRNVLFIVT